MTGELSWDDRVSEEVLKMGIVTDELIQQLQAGILQMEGIVEDLRSQSPDLMLRGIPDPVQRRSQLDDRFDSFFAQRKAWRVALLRACSERGMSVSEFSRLFGFTRQYGQMLAREAQTLPDTASMS
jgi:hypothetical protein